MAQEQLYADFWLALQDFCHYALLSKTGRKSKDGEIGLGNAGSVALLESLGVNTREDLEADCMIKVVDKLDNVLRNPIEKQKNYCYTMINNMVADCFRNLRKNDIKIVSLNETIEGNGIAEEDAYTLEDTIADYTYEPETLHEQSDTIKELSEKLKAKRAHEVAEKREAILHDLTELKDCPAQWMAWLACTHLGLKSREVTSRIMERGTSAAFAELNLEVAVKNNIEPSCITDVLAGCEPTEKSVKADTNDPKQISAQISRLAYRAGKHLENSAGKRLGK
jgi:hypothetical protein